MDRRDFLRLGAVAGGTIFLGDMNRFGRLLSNAAEKEIPSVDRLVMTMGLGS